MADNQRQQGHGKPEPGGPDDPFRNDRDANRQGEQTRGRNDETSEGHRRQGELSDPGSQGGRLGPNP
jgi:hypothetical protein